MDTVTGAEGRAVPSRCVSGIEDPEERSAFTKCPLRIFVGSCAPQVLEKDLAPKPTRRECGHGSAHCTEQSFIAMGDSQGGCGNTSSVPLSVQATSLGGVVEVDEPRASVRAGSGHSEALEERHWEARSKREAIHCQSLHGKRCLDVWRMRVGYKQRMDAVVNTFLRRRALLKWIQQSLSERQRVRRVFLRRCGTPLDLSPIRLSAPTLRYIRVIAHYCAPLVRLLGRRVSTKRQVANHILKMSKTVSRCTIVAWKDHVECAQRSRTLADNAVRNALVAAKEKLWRRWRARTRNRTRDNSNERSVVSVGQGGPSGEHCSGTGSARRIHLRGLNRRTGSDQRKGALSEALERHRWYSFKLRVYRGRLAIASRHYTARVLTVAIRQFRVYCGRHSLGSGYGTLRWRVQLPTGGTAPDLITDREDLGHSHTKMTRSEVLDSPPMPRSTKPLDIIPSLKNNEVNRNLDGTTFLDTPHPDTQALVAVDRDASQNPFWASVMAGHGGDHVIMKRRFLSKLWRVVTAKGRADGHSRFKSLRLYFNVL
eukprot:gene2583-3118_t